MVDMLAFYSDDSSSTRAKKNSSKFIKILNENQVTPLVLYIKKTSLGYPALPGVIQNRY